MSKKYVILRNMMPTGKNYVLISLKEYKNNELFRLTSGVVAKGTKRQLRKRGLIK